MVSAAKRLVQVIAASVILAVMSTGGAWAIDPSHQIAQYGHRAWRVGESGLQSTPWNLTQSTDGFIWAGTDDGLFRFDGQAFERWTPQGQPAFKPGVSDLFSAKNGDLFMGTHEGLVRISQGRAFTFPDRVIYPGTFQQDGRGQVWFAHIGIASSDRAFCAVGGATLRCYGAKEGLHCSNDDAVLLDGQGGIWTVGQKGLCHWRRSDKVENYLPPRDLGKFSGMAALAAAGGGDLWVGYTSGLGSVGGLYRFSRGRWTKTLVPACRIGAPDVRVMFTDSRGALWIGTEYCGVYRLRDGRFDHFDTADGLTGDFVTSIIEDREGSIWVGTTRGVDQFFDLPIIKYATREGLGTEFANAVAAAPDGSVWVAGRGRLSVLRRDKIQQIDCRRAMGRNPIRQIFIDRSGVAWLASDQRLATYQSGRFKIVRTRRGYDLNGVSWITEDEAGDVWASAIDYSARDSAGGIFRFRDGRVIGAYPAPPGQLHAPIDIIAPDGEGALWVGLRGIGLFKLRDGVFSSVFQPARVKGLAPAGPGQAWVLTWTRLWWADRHGLTPMTAANGLPCERGYSLLLDRAGDLWAAMQCGLIRISRDDLARWRMDPTYRMKPTLFEAPDGFREVNVGASIGQATDGRLFFPGYGDGLEVIDPPHTPTNHLPPPVSLEKVTVDHLERPLLARMTLPKLTRALEIDYAGLSFIHPDALRFKYRLLGYEHAWNDVGTRRQAFYNDLPPGSYRFQVTACNNDSACNETGAELALTIPPAWWQTWWFKAACILGAMVAVLALVRWRLGAYAKVMRLRFDERLGERTRVARDLHDTLMQTVMATKLLVDDSRRHRNEPGRLDIAMTQISDWLGRAAEEGRTAVETMRATTSIADLAEALELAALEARPNPELKVRVSTIGPPRALHPIAQDEVFRIGCEAIRNTCSHAGATKIDVELIYSRDLSLRVHDDGLGIDPDILESGKPSHFGLAGMRERADHIGAKLTISSSAEGVEIRLVVPGRVVFKAEPGLLGRLAHVLKPSLSALGLG